MSQFSLLREARYASAINWKARRCLLLLSRLSSSNSLRQNFLDVGSRKFSGRTLLNFPSHLHQNSDLSVLNIISLAKKRMDVFPFSTEKGNEQSGSLLLKKYLPRKWAKLYYVFFVFFLLPHVNLLLNYSLNPVKQNFSALWHERWVMESGKRTRLIILDQSWEIFRDNHKVAFIFLVIHRQLSYWQKDHFSPVRRSLTGCLQACSVSSLVELFNFTKIFLLREKMSIKSLFNQTTNYKRGVFKIAKYSKINWKIQKNMKS